MSSDSFLVMDATSNCSDEYKLKFLLYETFASNNSIWTDALSDDNKDNCNYSSQKLSNQGNHRTEYTCEDIYAYVTPIIVVIGILDDVFSLTVFMSKFMRRLSSTCYLATLSACHLVLLMTYVLFDWLHRGLSHWPGHRVINWMAYPGVCQMFLYISYTFRFASVWLIVAFAVERYVAICHPQHRRVICARPFAKKVTIMTILCACVFSAYKPALSVVFETKSTRDCVANPDYLHLNFIMDSIYVIIITALPSFVISALSVPILQKLRPTRSAEGAQRLVFKEHRIRLELTVILLAIAWCFILLTLSYFVTWCLQFFQSVPNRVSLSHEDDHFLLDAFEGQVAVTMTVFYLNYATNFFLYCMTCTHYRRQVRSILRRRFCHLWDAAETNNTKATSTHNATRQTSGQI